MIKFDRLKDGKKFALTLSYDDGQISDRKLVEIMDRYGIRGTFHLNSSWISGRDGHIKSDELKTLYKNHEISCHGAEHHALSTLSEQNIINEIMEDRRFFEQFTDAPVRGMSYANGDYNDSIINALKNCGIVYARTTASTHGFALPKDFMQWHPTCHHRDCLEDGKRFLNVISGNYFAQPLLLYVWGHSYEFAGSDNWEVIEEFCKMMGGREDIWYATNIEIYEYITAQKSLVISVDNKKVYNPSAITVWFSNNGETFSVAPGETLILK